MFLIGLGLHLNNKHVLIVIKEVGLSYLVVVNLKYGNRLLTIPLLIYYKFYLRTPVLNAFSFPPSLTSGQSLSLSLSCMSMTIDFIVDYRSGDLSQNLRLPIAQHGTCLLYTSRCV